MIQDNNDTGQWRLSPLQSRHLGTSHSSPNCHQLPVVFSWILLKVWSLFPFKGDFSFGKSQKLQGTKSGLWWGLSHLGDLMFRKKTLHETWCVSGCVVMNLPVTSCPFLWPSESSIQSMEECSSLMQNLMQTHCSTRSVILNATATPYTCSLNGVYCPHWVSTMKLTLFMHLHSSPFSLAARLHQWCANRSCYINNGSTFSRQTSYIPFKCT